MSEPLDKDNFKDIESLSSKILGNIKDLKRIATETSYVFENHRGIVSKIQESLKDIPSLQTRFNDMIIKSSRSLDSEAKQIQKIKDTYVKINDKVFEYQRTIEKLSQLEISKRKGEELSLKLEDQRKNISKENRNIKKAILALDGDSKKGLKGELDILKDISDELDGQMLENELQLEISKKRLTVFKSDLASQVGRKVVNEEIVDLIQKQIFETESKAMQEEKMIKELQRQKDVTDELLNNKAEELKYLQQVIKDSKVLSKTIKEQAIAADNLVKNFENLSTGKLLIEKIAKIPLAGKLFDASKAMDALRNSAAKGALGVGGIFNAIIEGLSGLSKAVIIVAIFEEVYKLAKLFIDLLFGIDKQITALARGMSVSKDEASKLRDYFADIRGSLKTQYKDIESIIEAQKELFDLTSLSARASQETLDAQIQLTKEIGLSKEEALELNKTFIAYNVEGNKGIDIALEQVANYANQNKILFNGKKILSEISKVSGQILLSFQGNYKALANSVIKMEALGLNLEKARDISRSFLDFESSIESELEAEILTGKSLNFERARGLALQGKFADAAEDAAKQMGTWESFSKLNVIQQESMAKSIGISVDELSNALLKQKLITKESKAQFERLVEAGMVEQAQALARGTINKDDLRDSLSLLDAQEKFTEAIKKAKDIFTQLVDGGTLDKLASLLNQIVEGTMGVRNYQQGITNSANLQGKTLSTDQQSQIAQYQQAIEDNPGLIRKGIMSFLSKVITFGSTDNAFGIQDSYKEKEAAANDARSKLQNAQTNLGNKNFKGGDIFTTPQDVQDTLIRPGQQPVRFNKDDLIMAGTGLMSSKGGGGGDAKVDALLDKMDKILTAMQNPKDIVLHNHLNIDSAQFFDEASKHTVQTNI
jgi:hypothetical protein